MDNRSKGFTLVELLVVIAIIGMLAALITAAVAGAMNAAKRARIRMEMGQIEMALERYKSEFGAYPPDLYDSNDVLRHIKKRWPRFSLSGNNITSFRAAINNVYRSANRQSILSNYDITVNNTTVFMGPDPNVSGSPNGSMYISAIPFWLGGFPNEDGKFDGFCSDPTAPFGHIYDLSTGNDTGTNDGSVQIDPTTHGIRLGTQDKKTFIEMSLGKNVGFAQNTTNNIAHPCFINKLGSDLTVPYVYFKGKSDGGALSYYYETSTSGTYDVKYYNFPGVFGSGSTLGIATPYASGGDPYAPGSPCIWHKPNAYQVIHPGLDGVFGATTASQTGNVTNTNMNAILIPDRFRSTNPGAAKNNIGQADFDNMTNLGESTVEALMP